MIFSPENNLLMVQNLKVGGTSLKLSLIDILPETACLSDISTGTTAAGLDPITHKSTIEKFSRLKNNMKDSTGLSTVPMHSAIANAKEYWPDTDFNLVTSFVFVRNPFDMAFSMFVMNLQQDFLLTKFFEYTKEKQQNMIDEHFATRFIRSTKPLYTSFGDIDVTHVFKYENGLVEQVNTILPSLGLPMLPSIPYFAKKYKPESVTYKDYFREEHLAMLREEWSWEFDMFGYNPYPNGIVNT